MPDSYSRRHFLKLSAALLAGGAAIAAAPDARGMGFSGVPDVGRSVRYAALTGRGCPGARC